MCDAINDYWMTQSSLITSKITLYKANIYSPVDASARDARTHFNFFEFDRDSCRYN